MSVTLEKIVSLAKRRGFIYQGSEIYGGLAGTWDYGPMGTYLKRNIEKLWWQQFVDSRSDMYPFDSAILMNSNVWETAGHVDNFNDPLVEDTKTHKRYRADHLLEENGLKDVDGLSLEEMGALIKKHGIKSPEGNELLEPKQFNMMFQTSIGSVAGDDSVVYLRPETAQGMFVNFKNILDTFHPKIPFGIAQIGKSFRNEINARDFLFRVRELEIMELEYFVEEKDWEKSFEYWRQEMGKWFTETLGFDESHVQEKELSAQELAHYSKRTVDFHYKFPMGFDEVGGLAYRTDHDLKLHQEASNTDLQFHNPVTNERFIPHVVEPTFGLGRNLLAVLCEAYPEEDLPAGKAGVEGETRVVMKFKPSLAPIKIAVLPLMKKEPLAKKAQELYQMLSSKWISQYDETGSIGKRYRRQDEIGTPFCVTIDYDTLEDESVTVRDRDTMKQERITIAELEAYFQSHLG